MKLLRALLIRFPQIVTRESAVIDGQNEIVASVLQRDHRTMVKFGSRDETGYNQFVGAMKDVIDEVRRERTLSSSTLVGIR